MDVRRLDLLRALSRLGTVTAVAHTARLTPTAVSAQLKALEREAGTALLRKSGRGVELTEAGRVLAEASGDVEAAQARLQATWDRYRGELAGEVTLTFFPTAGQLLLPGLLDRVRAWPEVSLRLVEADRHADDYPALTDHADLVIGHHSTRLDGPEDVGAGRGHHTWNTVSATPLYVEPLDVAVAADHRLAGRARVGVREVREEEWISVAPGWPFDVALREWFAAEGLTPRITHRFTDLATQSALVAGGAGIALLPRYAASPRAGDRMVLLPTRDLSHGRQVSVLGRRDRAERVVVQAVVETLVALAAEAVAG